MRFRSLAAALALTLSSQFAFAHGGEARVEVELESPPKISAGHAVISFQLVDTKENKVVTPSELNISHEKKLHFIAYDPGLKEFQHLHPEFDGKAWNVDADFAVDGNYFIWTQGELSIDSEEFNGLTRIEVTGGQPASPAPTLSDVRSGAESGSVATLSNQILKAGRMAMLTLKFTKTDGSPGDITPYLGAFAHIISTGEDGDSLIHVHPMNGGHPNEGMVHVTFPDAGFYRLWVQFIDAGVLKVIPLSVRVN